LIDVQQADDTTLCIELSFKRCILMINDFDHGTPCYWFWPYWSPFNN